MKWGLRISAPSGCHGVLMHMQVGAQVGSIMATGLGAAALMKGPYPRVNFFVAGVFVYMGTIVLEAVSMSLCSKARPAVARLASGWPECVGMPVTALPMWSLLCVCVASC